MRKVDISKWKYFHLYDDHMFIIDSGSKLDRSKVDQTRDDYDFVGRTGINNGINAVCGYYKGKEPYPAGYLTLALGGSIGSCFIQQREFYTSQNVVVLIPKDKISENVKRFIACVIQKESTLHYQAFVKELNSHIKTDFVIPLPATEAGTPDWDYMERYIGEIERTIAHDLPIMEITFKSSQQPINTDNWADFRIGDLFITDKKGKQVPTGANVPAKELVEGTVPKISVSGVNNGIVGYYSSTHKNYRTYKNFISVSFLSTVFYHPYEAQLDMKVHCLKPKNRELNTGTGLFLVAAIKASLTKYSYADQISSTLLPTLTIKLPEADGQPDWDYMEQYTNNLMTNEKQYLSILGQIAPETCEQAAAAK